MSNPLAIATVTTTLGQYLGTAGDGSVLPGIGVSSGPPDTARAASATGRQLNLFLYRVSTNSGLQNMDLPIRDGSGDLVRRPVLSLNLHYLLTAYADDELEAEHVLAQAMSLLHDQGALSRDQIRAAILAEPKVAGSDLADQVEMVKICPEPASLEEISKLWSMFPTTNYRLSTTYLVSVVLISRPHAARSALPVRAANLYAMPFRLPVIEAIVPAVAPPSSTLRISGRNLRADVVTVKVGMADVAPDIVQDRLVTVTLPATLPAGLTSVRISQQVQIGTPATPHRGWDSNVAAFVLTPVISTAGPISVARDATLTLSVAPPISRAQQVAILLNSLEIAIVARPPGSAPVTSLDFAIPKTFPTGTYLLRLRVDGAESPLVVETDPSKPTFNQYVGPTVTIT